MEKKGKMKHYVTREMLIEAGVSLVRDERELGGYYVNQIYHITKVDRSSTWRVKRPVYLNFAKHPNGKDKGYLLTSVKLKTEQGYYKSFVMPLHRLVYIYFNGNYPEGYDIAHLDDDALNCYSENLKAIPHEENIKVRKYSGANQYKNSVKNCDPMLTKDKITV